MSTKPRLAESFVVMKQQHKQWIDKHPAKVRQEIDEFIAMMLPGREFAEASVSQAARHIQAHYKLEESEQTVGKYVKTKLLELSASHEQPQTKSRKHVPEPAGDRVQASDRPRTRRRS